MKNLWVEACADHQHGPSTNGVPLFQSNKRLFLGLYMKKAVSEIADKEKALIDQGFNVLAYGGGGRNRTGVDGFASRCITILLLRHGYLNKG